MPSERKQRSNLSSKCISTEVWCAHTQPRAHTEATSHRMYAASSPLFQPTINRKSKKVASALTPLVERQFEEQSRKKERLHQLTERVEREQQAEATFSPRLSKAPPYLDLAGRIPLSERTLPSRPSEPPLDPEATFRPKTNHSIPLGSSERRSFSSSPQHSWGASTNEERMSSTSPSLSSSSALLDSQAKRQARELWREFTDGSSSMSIRGILSVLKTFGITVDSRPDLVDKFLMAMDVDEGDEAKRYVPYDRFLKVMTTVVRAAMVDGTTQKAKESSRNTDTNGAVRKIIQPRASSVQQPSSSGASSSRQGSSSSYKSPSALSDRSDRPTQATNAHKRALSEQSHRHMNSTGPTPRPTTPYANKNNNGKSTSKKGFHHIGVVDSDSEVNDASSDQESLPMEGRRGPPRRLGVEYFLSSPSQHRKAQGSRDDKTQRENSPSFHRAKKRASSSSSVSNDDSGEDVMSGARVLASDFSPLPQNPTRAGPRASPLSSFAERERAMKRGQGAAGEKSRSLASRSVHMDPHDTHYGEGDDVQRPQSSSQKREKVSPSSLSPASASSPNANKAHGHTHRPMINPLSYSATIAQRREAEGGLAGRPKMSEKALARQEQLAAEREEKEKALCSFRPQTLGGIDPRVSVLLKAAKERRESRGPSTSSQNASPSGGAVTAKRSSSEVRNPPPKRSASSMRGQGDGNRAAPQTRSSESSGGGKSSSTSYRHQEDHFDDYEQHGISPSPKQHDNAEVSRSRSVSTSGSAMGRSDRVIVQMPKDPPGFDKVIRRLAEGRARAVPKFEDALRSAAGSGSSLMDSKGEAGGPTEPKPFVLASEARQQERAQRKPLLFVDVNLPHGKSGRIGVYNGDDPSTLAHNFCVTYGLDTDALEQLTVMLQQRIDITLRANAIRKVWA